MTNEPKHTPTPWQAIRLSWGGYAISSATKNIAGLNAYQKPKEEQAANAAFIVRAVNAHDTLVKVAVDFDCLPKEVMTDAGIEYVRIPYLAFALWHVKHRAALARGDA